MLTDSQALLKTFPEVIKKGDKGVPNEIIIGEEGYCGAWMSAIYAGIRIARDIGANCLFSKREHNFLKYLYGMESNKLDINNVYSEIFSLYMPEGLAIHNYAFVNEDKCKQCAHYKQCKESYLCDTEQALKKMFKWRDYDELQQAKEEINKIIVLKMRFLHKMISMILSESLKFDKIELIETFIIGFLKLKDGQKRQWF